jgi:hypothetical protein
MSALGALAAPGEYRSVPSIRQNNRLTEQVHSTPGGSVRPALERAARWRLTINLGRLDEFGEGRGYSSSPPVPVLHEFEIEPDVLE